MSRPKSMTDFSNLLTSSQQSILEKPRKKPSISLAAGLIMAAESPKSIPNTPSQSHGGGGISDNLFYAYGRRVSALLHRLHPNNRADNATQSDYAQYPPYLLTFSSVSIASQWWDLVKTEYPDSTREGTQLFTFKGEDIPGQIWDNGKFSPLKNKWFYSQMSETGGSASIIPLQDERGNPISSSLNSPIHGPARPSSNSSTISPSTTQPFDLSSLSATLEKMNAMIAENTSQIKALSVAQSSGLQRMQEINESNAAQIKALADGQSKLQSLVDQNATHYIALSNSQFQNQEQVKNVMKQNAEQIKALASGQSQLASACKDMMKAVGQMSESLTVPQGPVAGGRGGLENFFGKGGSVISNISPGPRKLNRRIKGVWYEYDSSTVSSPRTSVSMETPPRSPVVRHVKFENGC